MNKQEDARDVFPTKKRTRPDDGYEMWCNTEAHLGECVRASMARAEAKRKAEAEAQAASATTPH